MPPKISDALAILREELATVDRELASLESLRARRTRIMTAIEAASAIERPSSVLVLPLRPTDFEAQITRIRQFNAPSTPTEGAIAVLREEGRAMHIRDIIGHMQARGWFREREYDSLRGTIAGTLDLKAKGGVEVHKPEPATYELIADERVRVSDHASANVVSRGCSM